MTPNDDPVRQALTELVALYEANRHAAPIDEANGRDTSAYEHELWKRAQAALSTRPQAAAAVPLTYQFEVWQDDMCVASGEGPELASIKAEAAHYAANYAQDGPVKVEFYGRFGITPPEGASE
jgi:hypothetical protein